VIFKNLSLSQQQKGRRGDGGKRRALFSRKGEGFSFGFEKGGEKRRQSKKAVQPFSSMRGLG